MDQAKIDEPNRWLFIFIGIAVLVNFSGLFIPIMGPDGTLYALIAKTMVQRHDYINLFEHGKDWLDKPHFPFWITALSFKCFGFKTWAYKLPAILFLMMGAVYTYLFAKNLYNKRIALWSVLILLTAQHLVLSNNDVRAEPYLTGLIIAAVYHFYNANKSNSFWQLFIGSIFAACAIMTKGMFAFVPIGGALAGEFIIKKQWNALFNFKWVIGAFLIFIFILPELYCLYQQFDMHPEKVVFGKTGVSGIKFFFLDSQFGRFFNTGPIKGGGDPFFFFHTILWAFLPWSALLIAAIFQFIKRGVKNTEGQEWYCLCGSLLTFLLFSASKFQLPHYLNIVFPFFAILTAQYINAITSAKTIRAIRITQLLIIALLWVLVIALNYFFKPEFSSGYALGILILLFVALFFYSEGENNSALYKIFYRTALASFIINLYLNIIFYPSLLHYQAGSEAAIWVNKNNNKNLPVVEWNDDYVSAFEFYSDKPVTAINTGAPGEIRNKKPFLLYAPANVVESLSASGWHVTTLCTFNRYWVSRVKPSFLNKTTRAKELTTTAVVMVN